jgi:ankyrin repeat protein
MLLQAGAEVDTATGDGSTPLMLAAEAGYMRVITTLLRAGPLVDKTKGKH